MAEVQTPKFDITQSNNIYQTFSSEGSGLYNLGTNTILFLFYSPLTVPEKVSRGGSFPASGFFSLLLKYKLHSIQMRQNVGQNYSRYDWLCYKVGLDLIAWLLIHVKEGRKGPFDMG